MNVLRSSLFYIGYVSMVLVSAVTLVPAACFLPLRPRFSVLNLYNRTIIAWFSLCCGVTVRVRGGDRLPAGPCVILSNHQSEWETLFLQLLKPPTCTVLKKELLKIPVFGWALRLVRPIPLDRSRPSVALKQVLSEGAERLREGLSVLIFPEGTRVPPGSRKPFSKSGVHIAWRAGVPVVPIAHNAGECWTSGGWIKRPGRIEVVIGEPIATEGRDVKDLLVEVENWIEDQLEQISTVPRPSRRTMPVEQV
ncbi:lysophospholipid acyltransferase family protein [Halotalea alkalilenta]|uniref:lysophospholipid acyltransferase family protein n=1 Tax=Halotalea alkalilenta TaxID=376489 RepID=UPI0004821002|nr:lysophospholipid acyltransferase family protein [Halotalea alkalilenta]